MAKKVFIIDDDPIYTFSMRFMLKQAGLDRAPEVFQNGREALDRIVSSSRSDRADLILLDINMPVMDGWEFLEALPDDDVFNQIEIYMVTSSISEVDRDRAEKNQRLSGYLVKPVSLEEVIDLI